MRCATCPTGYWLISAISATHPGSAPACAWRRCRCPSPARRLVEAKPELAAQLATGGDDYELLFTAPSEASAAIGRLAAELELPITEIGTVEAGDGVRLLDAAGKPDPGRGCRLAAFLMLSGSRRTVLMLAGCQALAMTGASIVGTTGAIVGSMLTPDKALSTLPIAVQMTGMMAATIPAALLDGPDRPAPRLLDRHLLGVLGAAIATAAIFQASFALFCVGTFFLGIHNGFTQQYRFAAAEIADEAFRSKAISLVLAGGVVSAVFGPETAKWSRDLFAPVLFAGCYAMIVGLCLAAAVLLYFVDLPKPAPRSWRGAAGRWPRSRRSRPSSRRRWRRWSATASCRW